MDLLQPLDAQGAVRCAQMMCQDPEPCAVGFGLLSATRILEGSHELAREALDRSISLAEGAGLGWISGGSLAARAALRATQGQIDQARRDLELGRDLLAAAPNAWGRATAEVWAGFLDIAAGTPDLARTRLEAAERDLVDGLSLLDADVIGRFAIRRLALALGEPIPAGHPVDRPPLRIGPEGAWIRIGNSPAQEVTAVASRRVLLALAEGARRDPARPTRASVLVSAGWPGEAIHKDAAMNRLYVALHQLRKAGLGALLITRRDGYLLDAASITICENSAD